VLVPGGGPFADHVRGLQQTLRFSDEAAHAMALLAMEQFGHVLIDRAARLQPARTIGDIRSTLSTGKIPVWFPSSMVLATSAIPASWEVTSDSLAAWLAAELGASALLLIKQTDDFAAGDTSETLATNGVVDPAFPSFLSPRMAFHVAGPRHLGQAAGMFGKALLPGERIAGPHDIREAE
jgi:dihydroneopterin aldolase